MAINPEAIMWTRHTTHTTNQTGPWCGIEVEAYWVQDRPRYLYVRAHATRATVLREQRNHGQRAKNQKHADGLFEELVREFSAWEKARRSKPREDLVRPWTTREMVVLEKLAGRQPYKPIRTWIEDLAPTLTESGARTLYEIGDRVCVLGIPKGIR